ncbi:hypothetical protein LHU53_12055 [Rhodoferax sp. U2-2l]|uniref:hypothetical protein n=1 Tax=Rhodoferax sp. U2-2l TaxID=2884000 RepID=UPI001D0ABB67|nr:hypothetical protein [Rhodoferax sp. U2-2l]MCB8747638.1 hypothetical protein [Rhodoferax sp. U2-2l]
MLLVTLEDDDCANGGAFVFIGALASAIAKVKAQSKPLEVILNVERKLFGLVNGAIQVGALHPHDPETLVPLSKSDYGHGIVAIEELVAWGHSLSVPLDFKVAQNSAAPIAGRAAVSDASEHAHESPVRMTKAERQRMDDFFAEGLRRSQRVSEAAATARAAELARLNARDEYEASKARQQPAPVQESLAPMVAASDGPAPLTTGNIAFCFAGLRWNEQGWKDTLGSDRKWLNDCLVTAGQRGVNERRWNPVLIGAWLAVHQGHVSTRQVRARFQTVDLLKPWFDAWRTYEADNGDTP